MEAHAHAHDHHEMPTEGKALTGLAVSATLHCLTGCAIGEVAGVAIGTALGWTDFATIALAIGLAFLFGYGLTSWPLLRAGLALSAVIPIALASDTLSIATMEVVDNALILLIPGAMEAGLGDLCSGARSRRRSRVHRDRAGQPLAPGPRKGLQRGPRDRHSRRPAGEAGGGGGRRRRDLRRRGAAGRGDRLTTAAGLRRGRRRAARPRGRAPSARRR